MKNTFSAICLGVFCFVMTGCSAVMGNLPAVSAGLTGCPPAAITIRDEQIGYYNDTWTATCNGRTFYCTRQVKGNTFCSEALLQGK
jgi:hypothetical protein